MLEASADRPAPETEIEVTEAMLMAGLRALPYLPEETFDILEGGTLVSEVYRAMYRASPQASRPCHPERPENDKTP